MQNLVELMPDIGNLSHVVQTLQLAITPAFLLAAIASLMNVLSARLARIVDRARRIEATQHNPNASTEPLPSVAQLRVINRRISLISDSIFLCVASAIIVCAVVAVLFVARLIGFQLGDVIALMFIFAMLLLVVGLVLFAIEVRIATRGLMIREELLELER